MRIFCLTLAVCLNGGQYAPAPPTVAQFGVTNEASRMPASLPGGAIARGSIFRIQGWRLGPPDPVTAARGASATTLAGVSVEISAGGTRLKAVPLTVGEEEIHAVLPPDAPLGDVELRVTRDGLTSRRPAHVTVVESSFGAFSKNGRGWGPGVITNADGQPNSLEHAARPGESVRLSGTGLGRVAPQVIVAEKPAGRIESAGPLAGRAGVDEIRFVLPPDTPEGCYVPVRVRTDAVVSNTVTLAVSSDGGACSNAGNWIAAQARQSGSTGLVALLRVDLKTAATAKREADFPMDFGYAAFEQHPNTTSGGNPFYMFPPVGSCMTLAGRMSARVFGVPLAALDEAWGRLLDAGDGIVVTGEAGGRILKRSGKQRLRYSALLGGISPISDSGSIPLFLDPGLYRISVTGGRDVGPMETSIPVTPAIAWANRPHTVNRSRGVSVNWRPGRAGDLVLVTAMNSTEQSGALAVCSCLAESSSGQFHIPGEAVANLPVTPKTSEGLPMNLIILAEFPKAPPVLSIRGADRVVSFFASAAGYNIGFQ